ncbi:calpastatin [Novosphingobium sp. PC22D]|uniref:DUF1810 domain-containing protein n=1 Tax=Novosphingobium sp. PC22D TaxID=1962403 RepID=UPI000BF1F877|nr:DUF1810 domain-containing protein [Novosphingobium sp. PC22D]PEQ11904.1 calpastatin [Novosphingobium sp. PC22D]
MPDLDRFVSAQEDVYEQALAEIRDGAKRSHWIWFIFPQIAGLGRSQTARFYALADRDEARSYALHPLLGRRLLECTNAALAWRGKRGAEQIFGEVDAMKLRSSMTLFETVSAAPEFGEVLDGLFAGARDEHTLRLLGPAAAL